MYTRASFSNFLPPSGNIRHEDVERVLRVKVLLVVSTHVDTNVVRGRSRTSGPRPMFVVTHVGRVSCKGNLVGTSCDFRAIGTGLLVLHLGLASSATGRTCPRLVIIHTRSKTRFVMERFSGTFFKGGILREVRVKFVIRGTRPTANASPGTVELVLAGVMSSVVRRQIFFAFRPVGPIVLRAANDVEDNRPRRSSIPYPSPGLLFIILVSSVQRMRGLVSVDMRLFLLRIVTRGPFFAYHRPSVSPVVLCGKESTYRPLT